MKVFTAVISDGKVLPPNFIETGLKINTKEFLKILIDARSKLCASVWSQKVPDLSEGEHPLFVPKEI